MRAQVPVCAERRASALLRALVHCADSARRPLATLARALHRLLVAAAVPLSLLAVRRPQRNGSGRTRTAARSFSDLPPPPDMPEPEHPRQAGRAGRRDGRRRAGRAGRAPASAAPRGRLAHALAPRTVDPELEDKRKTRPKPTEAAKAKAEEERVAAARAENCTRAQAPSSPRSRAACAWRAANAKGEREFLDDKQRADETRAALRDAISLRLQVAAQRPRCAGRRDACAARRASFGSIASGR